eukprot:m51a1_g12357 hypothetical protein (617) ;mRNA; f:558508-561363
MAQALESAQRQRLHAIWDLRKPSNEHADDWMDIILNVTMASTTVDRSLVWWLADDMSERARSAGFKRACPVTHGNWKGVEGRQCDVLNMHHGVSGAELRRAKRSGAWVNVYVVDSEWLFSQMWVLGVDSVTSTNPFPMTRMQKPAWTLSIWTYREVPLELVTAVLACAQVAMFTVLLCVHQIGAQRMPVPVQYCCVLLALFGASLSATIVFADMAEGAALRFVQHFAPALHLLALAAATCATFKFIRAMVSKFRTEAVAKSNSRRLLLVGIAYIGIFYMTTMLLLPLVVERVSTGIIRGPIPNKPRIIAHRGVSRIAPDNSLEGVEAASRVGMYGVEFDVAVTRDGVPVLLHDRTFRRTTDIDRVFPGRAHDDPSHFTSQEVSRLTLSRWCNRQCDGPASREAERTFRKARVPTMAQALESAQRQRLHAIWDLRKPSNEHAGDWMDIILNVTMASTTVDRSLVWWLADDMSERARSAGFKRACPVTHGNWKGVEGRKCDVLNMHHGVSGAELRRAKRSGAWVNVYVVDSEWLFSQMWVLGADSVTSTNPFPMTRMRRPAWTIELWVYRPVWILSDLACVTAVALQLYLVRRRAPDNTSGTEHLPADSSVSEPSNKA